MIEKPGFSGAVELLASTLVTCGVGALALRAGARRRRRRAFMQRLSGSDVELPLCIDHLPPDLGKLTVQARTLRLSLETPVRRYVCAPWLATPWGRRQICDEYDLAIVDVRRALWDWIRDVQRLSVADRGLLQRLGVDLTEVGRAFARPDLLDRTDDPWDVAVWPRGPDLRRLADGLSRAVEALGRFELALLVARTDPYR
jgi:hypothetical protein